MTQVKCHKHYSSSLLNWPQLLLICSRFASRENDATDYIVHMYCLRAKFCNEIDFFRRIYIFVSQWSLLTLFVQALYGRLTCVPAWLGFFSICLIQPCRHSRQLWNSTLILWNVNNLNLWHFLVFHDFFNAGNKIPKGNYFLFGENFLYLREGYIWQGTV
jgi:hypothetical protein